MSRYGKSHYKLVFLLLSPVQNIKIRFDCDCITI